MKRRRGFTLVEMLMVMSTLALVLGISVSLIFTLIKVGRSGRARVEESASLDRLARQFRADAHAATKGRDLMVKNDVGGGVELAFPGDRVVEYRRAGHDVSRDERGQAPPSRHELYRLPSRERASILAEKRDGRTWAVLVLPPQDDKAALVPSAPVRVEALVGKDHRFSGKKGDK